MKIQKHTSLIIGGITLIVIIIIGILISNYKKIETITVINSESCAPRIACYTDDIFKNQKLQFPESYGKLVLNNNDKLRESVSQYLEVIFSKNSSLDASYYCDSYIVGYDDKFIYSRALCESLNPDKTSGHGFSTPIRFEYSSTDYKIINHKETLDGSFNLKSIQLMFPKPVYDRYQELDKAGEFKKLKTKNGEAS